MRTLESSILAIPSRSKAASQHSKDCKQNKGCSLHEARQIISFHGNYPYKIPKFTSKKNTRSNAADTPRATNPVTEKSFTTSLAPAFSAIV